MTLFLVSLVVATNALQFVRLTVPPTNVAATNFFVDQFGMDFTVTRTINISHLGLLDLGARGFAATGVAMIFNRATNQSLVRIEFPSNNSQRADDSNGFAFKPIADGGGLVLVRGVYCLVAQLGPSDAYATSVLHGAAISSGDDGDGAILPTSAVAYLFGSILQLNNNDPSSVHAGASFNFSVVEALPSPPLSPALFADCEAVACAGLPSGEYNIRNQIRYCDNVMAGGGWMRLWRLNDTSCEANSWSSARSPGTWNAAADPLGCRPVLSAGGCKQGLTVLSPFRFSEVRGGNFEIWAAGGPNGFHAPVGQGWDGVQVNDGSGTFLWAFVVGLATTYSFTRCPCDRAFANFSATAFNIAAANNSWSCDAVQVQNVEWKRLFQDSLSCSGSATDGGWFQRSLPTPQGALRVSICKDEVDTDEDLKLSAGDLFVRVTTGFEKSRCANKPTSAETTTATAIVSTPTTATAPSEGTTGSIGSASSQAPTSRSDSAFEMISGVDSSWIIPTAVAAVLAVLLCVSLLLLVVVCRRAGGGAQRAAADHEKATTLHETSSSVSQYGYGDVSEVRRTRMG